MARKTLLTEAQVRQFMKLAHVPAIGSSRLQEMGYGMTEEDPIEDEEVPDDLAVDPAASADAEFPPEGDVADELAPEMDVAPEDDMGDMGDSAGVAKEDEFADLVQQLADLVGVEVDLDTGGDAEAEMAPEDGLEVDGEVEVAPEDDGLVPEPEDVMAPEEEEEELPPMQERSQDDIVNEVARRIAKRIEKAQKKDAMVDQLAERILKRLTK